MSHLRLEENTLCTGASKPFKEAGAYLGLTSLQLEQSLVILFLHLVSQI